MDVNAGVQEDVFTGEDDREVQMQKHETPRLFHLLRWIVGHHAPLWQSVSCAYPKCVALFTHQKHALMHEVLKLHVKEDIQANFPKESYISSSSMFLPFHWLNIHLLVL